MAGCEAIEKERAPEEKKENSPPTREEGPFGWSLSLHASCWEG